MTQVRCLVCLGQHDANEQCASILCHSDEPKRIWPAKDADYRARLDRACTIPSGNDWNSRFLEALDFEGLMIAIKWDGVQDDRYPWPGAPITAPFPFGDDGPTWPRGAYVVYKL